MLRGNSIERRTSNGIGRRTYWGCPKEVNYGALANLFLGLRARPLSPPGSQRMESVLPKRARAPIRKRSRNSSPSRVRSPNYVCARQASRRGALGRPSGQTIQRTRQSGGRGILLDGPGSSQASRDCLRYPLRRQTRATTTELGQSNIQYDWGAI